MDFRAIEGEEIISPFEEPSTIYFIAKGRVNIMLHLPFVKTARDSSIEMVPPSSYQVLPYYGQKVVPGRDEMVYVIHQIGVLGVGEFFPPLNHDGRGIYKSYTFTAVELVDCVVFDEETVRQSFPPIVIEQMKQMEEVSFPNELQVRELQEYYLSTRGYRTDNESAVSQMLAKEVERERELAINMVFRQKQEQLRDISGEKSIPHELNII